MGTIVGLLLLCFADWFIHRNNSDNSAKQREYFYGTFQSKIQKSENIYQSIRDKEKCDYIKMDMNNSEYN